MLLPTNGLDVTERYIEPFMKASDQPIRISVPSPVNPRSKTTLVTQVLPFLLLIEVSKRLAEQATPSTDSTRDLMRVIKCYSDVHSDLLLEVRS